MNVSSTLSKLVPTADGPTNMIRESWDKLRGIPGGTRLFSRLVGIMAPYTGTIDAHVVELRDGFAEVHLRDRRAVRNHLGSVHAVALANLAELTGNVALAYSLPDDARFIVAKMSIEYLKKARGTLRGRCVAPLPETSERREYEVPVEILDARGDVVVRATLHSLVGPKPQRS
jgi:uncharacterized protein (TIGR00369 family)